MGLMSGAVPRPPRRPWYGGIGEDVKSVHGDVRALLTAGVVDHAEDGRILLPYDEIHVDFVLRAA